MTNEITQAEKKQILKDTYFNRAQSDADLTSQGRFKKETETRVTAVPTYPSLPSSSPWASAFDQNLEPVLGFSVDEMPAPAVPEEPTPSVASSAGVGSVEPVALPSVVNSTATEAKSLTGSTTIKRRRW